MKKQTHINETSSPELSDTPPSPAFRDEAAELKAIYEQSREAIEFHSHPEKMTPAELFNIDDL